ncbi:alpha/beta fold hydrolase [Pedobacter sp. 22163]|uniref:alpha/beta fold hydrolase n=1 Tax=Pedobacter sp. 22163 TaxID=3453883 RepID=UPI003F82B916
MTTQQKRKIARPMMALLTLAFSMVLLFTGCSKDDLTPSQQPKTFVLVHGAFQGGYAWQFVKAQLEASGQKVIVVDLPGHGKDQTPPATITLKSYRDRIVSAISGVNGKVILVAHSAGGSAITAVADSVPERIEKMVYIAAAIPTNGQSLYDITSMDTNSQLSAAIVPSADGITGSIPDDKVFSLFCQDGTEEVRRLLIANNRPEPTIPQLEKIVLKNSQATSVIPKYYVHTTLDRVATLDLQKKVAAAAGIKNVYTLNSGHCPFLSMPDKVTAILLQVIK